METEKHLSSVMGKVICELPMKLPSCNEYIRVCRTNPYMASKFKRDIEDAIGIYIADLPTFDRVKIHFHWIEESKRRDYDNICFSKKFILDALVKFKKLKNDNRKCVTAFTDTFEYAKEAKVILEIEEVNE
jgi:Holliday junction resolvase RusA-like endonuclease